MKAFAIRMKGTNLYLPRVVKGNSFAELEADGGRLGPRVVTTRHAAQSILSQWLRGHFYVTVSGDEWDQETELTVEPQADRVKADMEIVEFELVEVAK